MTPGANRPALLVAIDTEGDNQWSADARRHQRFENIYALERLHDLFAKHRVRPTYVVTYPVARDPRSGDVLRRLLARGDCEIGAHHHAWETPPCSAEDVRRHPYALQLPIAQFEAQLDALTQAIEEAVEHGFPDLPEPVGAGAHRNVGPFVWGWLEQDLQVT